MREFMVLERISERDKMAMSAPTLVVGFCPVAGYRFVSPRGYASGGRLVAIQARFSWPSNRITLANPCSRLPAGERAVAAGIFPSLIF
jgi:hypothetical protein